uniref:ATP synthase complex subunit 8 n=1 Tax=Viannamyia furcata TaxID=1629544 RepID=A0A343AWC9_9DIPT|nr:ATP synthase F0 subunit 8 [Viannamyia furcata]
MPQMAPLMWLSLFIFFLMMYCLYNIMNYYSYIIQNKSENNSKSLTTPQSSWKW